MANSYNEKEVLKVPEKRVAPTEEWSDFGKERIKAKEEKEISIDETRVADQLKQEIELMVTDESLKEEAKQKALKIEFLGEKEKIEHLLKIARDQGIEAAVKSAKSSGDDYLLDILRDLLSKDEYYKNIK